MTDRELSYLTVPGSFPGSMTPLSAFAVGHSAGTDDPGVTTDAGLVDFTLLDLDALGVLLKVSSGGTLGQISITNFVATLTTGLVLSQAAGVFVQVRVVDSVLPCLLPTPSCYTVCTASHMPGCTHAHTSCIGATGNVAMFSFVSLERQGSPSGASRGLWQGLC